MNDELKVPMFCPICELIMKGSKSVSSYYDYGCCINCYIQWIEDRVERWKTGWRPTKDMVDRFLQSLSQQQ